jgi:hypothetical protein
MGVFMKCFTKVFVMLLFLFSFSLYGQVKHLDRDIYSIGTGLSTTYFNRNAGLVVDSYHFFNARGKPNHKGFFKIGLGFNLAADRLLDDTESPMGFLGNVSIGYMCMIDDVLTDILYSFGAGISVDYSYAYSTSYPMSIITSPDSVPGLDENFIDLMKHKQLLGVTLYLQFNEAIVGVGTGIIVSLDPSEVLSPYGRISLGMVF